MSKVDAMRAMREARYARGSKPPDRSGAPPAKAVVTAGPVGSDELCGHRNMGGKSCSRAVGHSEKNHRYATA